MKRLLFSAFIFLIFVSPGFSQSSVWVVENNKSKFFIGGSIHILREQDFPLPKEFENAFSQSQILVLETDISSENTNSHAKELIGLTLYPGNKSLKTELRKDVYEKLDSVFKQSGISLEIMMGYKPVMAILTLTQIELSKMGITSEGVDKYFYDKAVETSKERMYLESIEEQIKLISEMGEGNENEFVLQSLEELDFYNEMFEEILENWRRGDETKWLEWIETYSIDFPELYEDLLEERNDNWMPKLESYFDTPETEFIVVGAMHLFGPDGLLQKLEEKGFTVTQL